ncbi:MAG: hypothetical protein HY661_04470 [Betaproteobacteria bacterium]|nr:hypothetical protein [Betaproteobacteria bacterium]
MVRDTLASIEQAKYSYGDGCAEIKLALLARLEHSRLRSARALKRLHEVLCFLRAYPDDPRILAQVEKMLEGFHRRADLRRHRAALADTGIAGTHIYYRFFWSTARWLAHRWPDRLALDRSDRESAERIRAALPLLVTPAEAHWLKEAQVSAFKALDKLRAPGETDAAFLVRRVHAMNGDSMTREAFFDAIDAAYRLMAGAGTPSRTHARHPDAPAVFRNEALRRSRPALDKEISRAPRAVRELSVREGSRLIDLARGVMVTHARDLDAFAYGDPRDVRLVEDSGGLAFMVNGVIPERRALMTAMHGFLTLQNGVPIGYGDIDIVARSAAISFNTFETYRGGEAASIFARLLAMIRRLFGADSFSLAPYQLGWKNHEAIAAGAWWFYYKLGFRPQAAEARRIMREELARMRADPNHRSERSTLRKLAASHVFYDFDPTRPAGLPPVAALGERIARALAQRSRAGREQALKQCSREAMEITGLRSLKGFNADERSAWLRWSPLIASIPEISGWSRAEKRALVQVVRAKGARCESDFVARFAAHPKLERALFESN